MNVARRALLLVAIALLCLPTGLAAQAYTGGAAVTSIVPSPYRGPIAPDFGGEIGLFTIPTADTLPAGGFSFGLYLQNSKLIAGQPGSLSVDEKNRFYELSSFQGSLGYGISRHIEMFVAAGEDRWESRSDWVSGTINGLETTGAFKKDEGRKIRIGAKVGLWGSDSDFRLAIYTAVLAPVINEDGNYNTRRTDWNFGASGSIGILTGNVDYLLSSRRSTEPDVRVPNRIRFAAGTDVPFGPVHWISEIDRNVFDGPDVKPPDYSNFLTGARIFIGKTGWAASAAIGINIDMAGSHSFGPSPLGGLLGLTYAPFPAPPPPPRPLPPPPEEPATQEQPEVAPAPVEAPPAPPVAPPAPQSKTTTDVIQFDQGSSRLTNIAKAILDGVALRMKNDLNSTALITGYSDNSGSEDANQTISVQRSEAAKAYLVERHGIDAARIRTDGRGSAEPVSDNATAEGRAKNRRAVIVVTFPAGS